MGSSGARRTMARLAAGMALCTLAASCADGGDGGSTKLRVVAAFYPIEMAARAVGGEAVAVTNLTPPGGEPHDIELKPSDVTTIRGADLVLYFGGFQPALDDAIEALPNRARAIDLLDGLPLNEAVEKEGHGDEDRGEEGDEHAADPHVWLSPVLMQRLVDRIADAVARAAPSDAETARANAAKLKQDLSILHQEFERKLASCERREIFTSHAAFGYLADEYELRQISISGLSPEAEPSSKRLQSVAREARAGGATTIFFETLVSPRVSRAVARIVGAKTAVLDPLEGLTREDAAAGRDYFSVMRVNLANLTEALGCKP